MESSERHLQLEEKQEMAAATVIPLFQPLVPPKLTKGDPTSIREFLRRYDEYVEVFEQRKEANNLGEDVLPTRVKRCVERRLRSRIMRYEMKVDEDDFTDEALLEHLSARIAAEKKELTLDEIFKPLRFDESRMDPADKVGRVFEMVDQLLEDHNIEGVFPDKAVTKYIVEAVRPMQLQRRVEYHTTTVTGKAILKSLPELYEYLVEMYSKWYELHPTGRVDNGTPPTKPSAKPAPKPTQQGKGKKNGQKEGGKEKAPPTTPKRTAPVDGTGCWNCKGDHYVYNCPTATPEMKARGQQSAAAGRRRVNPKEGGASTAEGAKRVRQPEGKPRERRSGERPAVINGAYSANVALDWMASRTTLTTGTLQRMRRAVPVAEQTVDAVPFEMGNGESVESTTAVFIDIKLDTRSAPVNLRKVCAFVLPGPDTSVLLGEPELSALGFTDPTDRLDEIAAAGMVDVEATNPLDVQQGVAMPQRAKRVHMSVTTAPARDDLVTAESDEEDVPERGVRARDDGDEGQGNSKEAVEKALADMLRRAEANGAPRRVMVRLTDIVMRYQDVFKLELGRDGAANVEPFVIDLINEEEMPRMQRARRFAPLQMQFLHEHVKALLHMGVVRRSSSAYGSPVVLARKKDGTWRMCVDLRRINANTRPMRWPLPKIHELLPHLAGAAFFASFDLLRGFWQFPVEPGSTPALAFVTHEGLFEFTRVVMGARNSAAHFQKIMQSVLGDLVLVAVLLYLDDVLVYAKTEDELLDAIERVLECLRRANISVKPTKCDLYARKLVWCGHTVSAEGVSTDPAYVEAVRNMATPITAVELQQFLGSCGWVRTKIPAYAELIAPLQLLLNNALEGLKRRNARAAQRVLLADVGWGTEHADAFAAIKEALVAAVTLAHLDDDKVVCLFPDASDCFWGAILTQVPAEDLESGKPVSEWRHEPLAFLSGAFRGASLRWSVPDKEGYAIKESCARLSHMLVREGGFRIFTDHRNLRYIFNPLGVVSQINKPTADRLERWAVFLRGYDYVIEHIPGEHNLWADMLSRWAAGTAEHLLQRERALQPCKRAERATPATGAVGVGLEGGRAQRAAALTLRARGDRILTEPPHTTHRATGDDTVEINEDEQWPTMAAILRAQRAEPDNEDRGGAVQDDDGVWKRQQRVYIPEGPHRLRKRILVVAHAGAAGHRGMEPTINQLRTRFCWPGMEQQARAFIRQCILCVKTRGNKVVPRPLGKALQGAAPGDALHMDFVSMVEATGSSGVAKGLLVLKDGFSAHVTLWPADAYDAATAEEAVVAWAALHGVPRILVTDGGTHFDNAIVKSMQKRFRAAYHITTAYAPWANGIVERVMRELVRLMRTLLAETNIPKERWVELVPVVQSVINQTPNRARAGYSPNQLVFGRETPRPLDTIAFGRLPTETAVELAEKDLAEAVRRHLRAATETLQDSWLKAAQSREQRHDENARQRRQRLAADGREGRQFAVGEYVLVHVPVPRHKLRVQWLGPFRVVDTVNEWVYVVEDILTQKRKTVHADRI